MDDHTKVAKTLALQLAPQLPEDFAQAGLVLEYLQELRQWRNCPPYYPQADKSGDHEVVLLRREGVGGLSGNSPRR